MLEIKKKNNRSQSSDCPLFKSGRGGENYIPRFIFLFIASKLYKQTTWTFPHRTEISLHLHGTFEFDYSQELEVILPQAGKIQLFLNV